MSLKENVWMAVAAAVVIGGSIIAIPRIRQYMRDNEPVFEDASTRSFTTRLGRMEYVNALNEALGKFGDRAVADTDDSSTVVVRSTTERCGTIRGYVSGGGDLEKPPSVRVACFADGRLAWLE